MSSDHEKKIFRWAARAGPSCYLHHLRALKGAISDFPPSSWPFAVPRLQKVKGTAPDVGLASVADEKFDCNPCNACVCLTTTNIGPYIGLYLRSHK